MVRCGSDDGRGRVRSQTYPPRLSSHWSENSFQSDRESWFGNAAGGRRNSSPPRPSNCRVVSPLGKLEYGFGSGKFLQKRTHGGDEEGSRSWSTTTLTRTPPTPSSCDSGGSASSRNSEIPRAPRRRHYRKGGWGKEAPPSTTTRQHRLVSCMITLVVVLGSIQIFALILHLPRGARFAAGGLGRVTNENISNKNKSIRLSPGGGTTPRAGGLRSGTYSNSEAAEQQQHHGLSLSNPRAFELVTADMGHLKDTVEKLDLAFRETMGQQGRDLAAVMDQLGVQPAGRHKLSPETPPFPGSVRGRGTNGDERSNNERENERPAWSLPPPKAVGHSNKQRLSAVAPAAGGQEKGPNKQKGPKQAPPSGDDKLPGALGSAVSLPGSGRDLSPSGVVGAAGSVGERTKTSGAVWNAYQRGKWVNGQWIPKVLQDDTSPDLSKLASNNEQQRRVLLLSEKRSGGHAVGNILDADPRVFYVADPCRMGGGPEALGPGSCSLAVSRLLACQPTINDIRNLFSFSYIVERSRVLSEFEGLRWQAGGTSEENDEEVKAAVVQQCRLSRVVVVKETRLAEVGSKISAAELGTEFLHVVRDPRAAIHGMSERWQSSGNKLEQALAKNCSDMASRVCSSSEKKLKDLTELGKERFRVLKYEMFVEAPFAMAKSVYGWLDLGDFPQEVVGRIQSIPALGSTQAAQGTSHGTRAALGRFEWATRWAVEMPAFRRQQIQHACQPLLVALGYDEADSFEDGERDGNEQEEQGPALSSPEAGAARVGSVEGAAPSRGQGWRASASASSSLAAPVAEVKAAAGARAAGNSVATASAAVPTDHSAMDGRSISA